jgi:hypothetical protein
MENYINKEDFTGELLKFIHIGCPKGGSTALQKGFLGLHPEVKNLGCGNRDGKSYWDDLGYVDKNINIAMEVDLRYRNSLGFDKDRVKQDFEKHFSSARASKDIKAVGVSNENMSFQWNYGIDIEEKAKRLKDIFGEESKVILVVREQFSLINSLYKEQVRFGYSGSLNDFYEYLWMYKDRNFFYEFCFDKVLDVYEKYFNKDNILVLPFKMFKSNQELFLNKLSAHIGVKEGIIPKINTNFNRQLSDEGLGVKLEINKRYAHTSDKGFYRPFDNHRYIPYYTEELNTETPFEIYFDYHTRNDLCETAEKIARLTKVNPIDMTFNEEYKTKMGPIFMESNVRLEERYNVKLN